MPIGPDYMISMSEGRVVVRNYKGFISTYIQPMDYRFHVPTTCPYCQERRGEGGQEGVVGLLVVQSLTLAPEGWEALHRRQMTTVEPVLPLEMVKVVR